MVKRFVVAASLVLALAACQDDGFSRSSTRHLSPIPAATMSLMTTKGMSKSDPIVIRSYKKESEMEVWKRGSDGRYALLKSFPICRWSGQLGPKRKEGDRQAPEGFYAITPAQMNPNSAYYLSFDTGYPNAYDRAHGRTGAHLMVHGTCSSAGCYAMTDEAIAEVYAIARDAFSGGQRGFQFQAYPFRMTAENLAKHRADPHMAFWKNLKEGSDYFEVMKEEPKVAVANQRYAFGSDDPTVVAAVEKKRAADEQKVADLVAKGTPAVRVVYEDGGGHASFREAMVASTGGDDGSVFAVLAARPRRNLGEVSRPDALAMGPREIVIDGSKARPEKTEKPSTALAYADAKPALAATTAVPRSEPAPAKASESKSLYDRVFSFLGTSTGEEPAVVEQQPAAVPLPPDRGAEARPGERRVDLATPIRTAARPVPAAN